MNFEIFLRTPFSQNTSGRLFLVLFRRTILLMLKKSNHRYSLAKPFLKHRKKQLWWNRFKQSYNHVITLLVGSFKSFFMGLLSKAAPWSFLRKTCSEKRNKFTGEHPCQSVISIQLLCFFIANWQVFQKPCKILYLSFCSCYLVTDNLLSTDYLVV